ncbi:MAG: hypothetical protein ACKOI2_11760 [Actinomycetota bacterium]
MRMPDNVQTNHVRTTGVHDYPASSPARARALLLGVLIATAALASACVTGPRPTLGPTTSAAPITDPAISTLIDVLSTSSAAPFSVTYDVTTRYGSIASSAEVVFDPSRGTAILIDTVLFVMPLNDSAVTCRWSEESLSISECASGIDETRVSHLQLNSRVFREAAIDRLRRDAEVASGGSTTREETIAERPATCVDIPVIDGNGTQQKKSYCVFAELGILASLETADLMINAVFVDDIVTTTLFNVPNTDG